MTDERDRRGRRGAAGHKNFPAEMERSRGPFPAPVLPPSGLFGSGMSSSRPGDEDNDHYDDSRMELEAIGHNLVRVCQPCLPQEMRCGCFLHPCPLPHFRKDVGAGKSP